MHDLHGILHVYVTMMTSQIYICPEEYVVRHELSMKKERKVRWIAIMHALACTSTLKFAISWGRDDTRAMHLLIAVAEKDIQLCIYGVFSVSLTIRFVLDGPLSSILLIQWVPKQVKQLLKRSQLIMPTQSMSHRKVSSGKNHQMAVAKPGWSSLDHFVCVDSTTTGSMWKQWYWF